MLEPFIVEKIRENEKRRRNRRQGLDLPIEYPPMPYTTPVRPEDENDDEGGGTVIEIEL